MRIAIKLVVLALFLITVAHGQGQLDSFKRSIYQRLTVKPHLPGDAHTLDSFIHKSLHYPDYAQKNNIEGRTFVRFMIDEEGVVSHIEIVRSSGDHILDEEAKRVVSGMPRWVPGSYKGRRTKVFYLLPITFRIIQ